MATTTQSTAAQQASREASTGKTEPRRGISAREALLYTILVIYGVFSLAPFLFAFFSSFKTEGQVLAFPPTLLPHPATADSYKFIFSNSDFPIPNYIFNSLIYAGATAALNVVLGAMAGYAFGRMEFPGKNALFALTLAVLMIPGYLIMIPKFLVANTLGLTNSLGALIIPAMVTPTSVFLMTQFLKTLPKELEESAMIDGATRFGAFWRVIVPLIRPAMVTVAIFQFLGAWNDFIWPLLVMSSRDNYTLTVGLTFFKGVHYTQYSLLLAGAMINILPLVVVFFIFQRYFIKGVSTSGLAGR
jgi:ABC-type glycerol-3-phosphate transport system permease component